MLRVTNMTRWTITRFTFRKLWSSHNVLSSDPKKSPFHQLPLRLSFYLSQFQNFQNTSNFSYFPALQWDITLLSFLLLENPWLIFINYLHGKTWIILNFSIIFHCLSFLNLEVFFQFLHNWTWDNGFLWYSFDSPTGWRGFLLLCFKAKPFYYYRDQFFYFLIDFFTLTENWLSNL